jgi:hypothetical protein
MPFEVYNNFSDADLKALLDYLQAIHGVRNYVPEPTPPKAAK